MNRLVVWSGLAVLAALLSTTATAQVRSWDDLEWWAQSGAGPNPVKDGSRSGYWWWPTEPQSNDSDHELWGNRGVAFGMFTPTPPPPPPPPPPPVARPAPPEPAADEETIAQPERSIPVFNTVLFDFDQATLKASGRDEIAKVTVILEEYPRDTITIEGHTCDINRSGDPDYNLKLGQRRADAVRAVLIENGIDEARVSTVSYGENRPAVPNTSDENRQLNRRVVFIYTIGE